MTKMNKNRQWLKWISEIQALSQAGLTYAKDVYDKERYTRFQEIAAELAAHCSENDLEDTKNIFSLEKGHPTPKFDVRAFCLKEDKILLVRERSDNLWTLPGGWVDVNESASEAVIRETKEEAGFDVEPIKLLALWDKFKHDHPAQWPHVYKCFFHCSILGGEARANTEISEIDFFRVDKLPELSVHRVTKSQLQRLYQLVVEPKGTEFD